MTGIWRRRGLLRAISLLAVSAVIAAVVSSWGRIRDFGSFHASLLTGSPAGAYYVLGSQLAKRADRDGHRLDVVATAGSLENVDRLIAGRDRCVDQFAFVQDGTRQPEDFRLRQHEWYLSELNRRQIPFHVFTGSIENRIQQFCEMTIMTR